MLFLVHDYKRKAGRLLLSYQPLLEDIKSTGALIVGTRVLGRH